MNGGPAVRAILVLAGLLVIASCGSSQGPADAPPAAPPESVPTVAERFTPDIPGELRVREPKDARGIDPCDLLTGAQLAAFGLDPASARANPMRYGDGCVWRYVDGSTTAGIGISTDPAASKLPDIYRLRHIYKVVQILQLAGHPALRADQYERECALSLAVADDQIVGIDAYADERVLPDPCGPARRMAELIIANLTDRP